MKKNLKNIDVKVVYFYIFIFGTYLILLLLLDPLLIYIGSFIKNETISKIYNFIFVDFIFEQTKHYRGWNIPGTVFSYFLLVSLAVIGDLWIYKKKAWNLYLKSITALVTFSVILYFLK